MKKHTPKYINTLQAGRLEKKIKQAEALMSSCTLCPRQCRVNRFEDEKGYCGTGKKAVVASYAPHFGEEPPLVGQNGSGTIFFSHCNLKCVFCQNADISIEGQGTEIDESQLAHIMLELQRSDCHNINFVTPTHVVPQILKALLIAANQGLRIPLVYNSSAYESLETLRILKNIIDIYMPDFKFMDEDASLQYCHAADYPEKAMTALMEMQDQAGELLVDYDGIACSGLIVRHLVIPGRLEETGRILSFLKDKVSAHTHINLMSQYRPLGDAFEFEALSRKTSVREFRAALQLGRDSGLKLIR
jgi:putative pyruvate formate lyase activating enzyme